LRRRRRWKQRFGAFGILLLAVPIAATDVRHASKQETSLGDRQDVAHGPPLAPGKPLRLDFVQMMTPVAGWAMGGDVARPSLSVLRTEVGGTRWTDVTPGEARGIPSMVVFFLDLQHAWVVSPGGAGAPPRTITTFRTVDGGRTWLRGTPLRIPPAYRGYAPLGEGMQFVDPKSGWLFFGLEGAADSTGVDLYRTRDGGITWEEVSVTLPSPGTSSRSSLPVGCGKTGISFLDKSTGWATAHCPGGSPFLYVTRDAGRSWREQTLPPPADDPSLFSHCDCGTFPPKFASAKDGALMVRSPDVLYLTHDGGASWNSTKLPSRLIRDMPEFISPSQGWLLGLAADPVTRILRPDKLYATSDGGQTWEAITPSRELFGPLNFVSDRVGFSVYTKSRDRSLLKTIDGGHTWTVLQPVAEGSDQGA
jgi:photosystem II stability/assembly factor-like uncharacterized protein